MEKGSEGQKENQESVTRWRRIQDLRFEESIFEREAAGAGDHDEDSLGQRRIRKTITIPIIRHPKQLRFRHLNDCEHLAAIRNQGAVEWPHNPEGAPKPHSFEALKPPFHDELVSQFRRAAVINFCPDNHRIFLRVRHLGEAEPKLFGEEGARYLDETQISDIVNDGRAIGIEKHHLKFGSNPRRAFVQHPRASFPNRS